MGYLLICPLSPTFKYALSLKIKDLLLEYHTNKFPLILNYSHSSKYRVDFYKIQNPYRNWCDVTCNICMGSRQIQNHARKVSSYNMGKNNLRNIHISIFLLNSQRILASSFQPHYKSLPFCVYIFFFTRKKIAAEE